MTLDVEEHQIIRHIGRTMKLVSVGGCPIVVPPEGEHWLGRVLVKFDRIEFHDNDKNQWFEIVIRRTNDPTQLTTPHRRFDMSEVKPGKDTSEYKATRWAILLGALAAVIPYVQGVLPEIGLPQTHWGVQVTGLVGAVLAAMGYTSNRTKAKSGG